jgi:hypothetical protein
VCIVPVSVALLTWYAAGAVAHPAARLERWEGRATLIPNRGPGEEDFIIVAEVAWDRSALPGSNSYAIRTVLPGGQTVTHPLSADEGPASDRVAVPVLTRSVRNLRPEAVVLRVTLVNAGGQPISNELIARIDDFPTPTSDEPPPDTGPFGWGRPLADAARAQRVPRAGPDGLRFVRLPGVDSASAVCISIAEATNRQVAQRLKGYDPAAGRSDEFSLEAADQPALGLTPSAATAYLAALTAADRTGMVYRLPTQTEWLRAARADRTSAFWWGDDARHPTGANWLGPEPALKVDSTAPSVPEPSSPGFRHNPWGLYHTYGNVAEWAVAPAGGFVRLGGHFRTDPGAPLPEQVVADAKALGDDPYVGVRPAFTVTASRGTELAARALSGDAGLARVGVRFDPARLAVVLSGDVADAPTRRRADRRLATLWWVAAVVNEISTPTIMAGHLARIGPIGGPVRTVNTLGRRVDLVPLSVQWSSPMPVSGSTWWANVFGPDGRNVPQILDARAIGRRAIEVPIDLSRIGTGGGAGVQVALSLGEAAASLEDARIISNAVRLPIR